MSDIYRSNNDPEDQNNNSGNTDNNPWNTDNNKNQWNNNNSNNPWGMPPRPQQAKTSNTSPLSTAAMVFGIIGLVSILFSGGSVFFGAMAIILGLISRGTDDKPVNTSKYAIIMGSIGAVISLALFAFSITMIIQRVGGIDNLIASYSRILNSDSIVDFNQYMQEFMNQITQAPTL